MRWYLLWGSLVTLQWQSSHFEGPSAVTHHAAKAAVTVSLLRLLSRLNLCLRPSEYALLH